MNALMMLMAKIPHEIKNFLKLLKEQMVKQHNLSRTTDNTGSITTKKMAVI